MFAYPRGSVNVDYYVSGRERSKKVSKAQWENQFKSRLNMANSTKVFHTRKYHALKINVWFALRLSKH